ncbi:MAG: hypothetical protein LC772_11455, partial [Chloroflexi bacterium]|nr:hypothetical protein [Chloroflexota bacterium]
MDPTSTIVQPADRAGGVCPGCGGPLAAGARHCPGCGRAAAPKCFTGAVWADALIGVGLAFLLIAFLPFVLIRSGIRPDVVHWTAPTVLMLLAGPVLGLALMLALRTYRPFAWGLGITTVVLSLLEAFVVLVISVIISAAISRGGHSRGSGEY